MSFDNSLRGRGVRESEKKIANDDPTTGAKESDLIRAKLIIEHLIEELDRYRTEYERLASRNRAIETSLLWRASAPLRQFGSRHPRAAKTARRLLKLIWWTVTGQIFSRLRMFRRAREISSLVPSSSSIDGRLNHIKTEVRRGIIAARLPPQVTQNDAGLKISIILPTFKTPIDCLDQAILSVRAQTYPLWELCICDDGSANAELTALVKRHATSDSRIKFCALDHNKGISEASNAALAMASGDFVAFLDHDDLLLPDALMQFVHLLAADESIDVAYSDEAIIDANGEPNRIFTKPDWSPVLLLAMMYIGHLTVYRRSLVVAVGGLRSTYDFSQDFDLALRVTERARKIGHVPQILYCWRAIPESAAAGGKPFARMSNIAAATQALSRRGLNAVSVPLPQSNRYLFAPAAITEMVSIIVPSDNPTHIEESIASIQEGTAYANREVIVVTNSRVINALTANGKYADVKFKAYDRTFNFSDKCNVGAEAATGGVLIFFNDDVRVLEKNWIEALLESLRLEGVAGAGPKLLYENRSIQHAGMVVGVRRLVGTAFHSLPDDTGDHFNLAQCAREVTLLCGACLAIRAPVFREVGGFDALNMPISHSDVDLCLRIQEAGYRCVYTPHAKLLHVGHASIGTPEATKARDNGRAAKDKSDIFLLKRWCKEISYDPFFPPTIRDLAYRDSPEPYQVFAPARRDSSSRSDILIISHDLSRSGAPKLVYEMAVALKKEGHFVVVSSPTDGHYRTELQAIDVPVIVDALLLKRHDSVLDFARNFDRVIANTVVTWSTVAQLAKVVDVYWYLHESELVDEIRGREPLLQTAMIYAKDVWVGSKRAERIVKRYRPGVFPLEYGLDAWPQPEPFEAVPPATAKRPAVIAVFGSFEPRKGQDLAVLSVQSLSGAIATECELRLFGRVLDDKFHAKVIALAHGVPNIVIGGELTLKEYMEELQKCDIVLVPSRDDTLPLVSLDALRAGKVLICGPAVGTVDYLGASNCAIVAASSEIDDMSHAIVDALNRRDQWPLIGQEAKKVFDRIFSKRTFEQKLIKRLNLDSPSETELSLPSFAEAK